MEETTTFNEAYFLAKQVEIASICYDRLLEILHNTDSETVIIKTLETIRKDMTASTHAVSNKRDAINDTCERLAEIEKQLKKL